MRVGSDDVTIDRIGADGHAQPFLTAEQLGVGGIGFDTFAVDAPRNRLLLKVYSGTLIKPRDRRLIWIDLQTRDISPAMVAPLGRLDAPFAAVFSPGGEAVAFTVGRGGSGRYGCTIVRATSGAICQETASASHWHGADPQVPFTGEPWRSSQPRRGRSGGSGRPRRRRSGQRRSAR
jgi:hypothetical protein